MEQDLGNRLVNERFFYFHFRFFSFLETGWSYLIFVIFFTLAKFLENKIYTEIYTVNCQFTQ